MTLKPILDIPTPKDLGLIKLPKNTAFVTQWFLVYGTLKKNNSNYNAYNLGKATQYHGTFRLRGFQLTGIKASYTGHEDDWVVVDLLEVKQTKDNIEANILDLYEYNYQLDQLEGTQFDMYQTIIIPCKYNKEIILTKFYQNVNTKKTDTLAKDGSYGPVSDVENIPFIEY